MPAAPRLSPLGVTLPPLCAAILIGGAGRRMGRPKHLLEVGGETFIERLARVVAAVVPEPQFLGEGVVPASLAGHSRVADLPGVGGPLAGLLAAFQMRPDAAWLAIACDQPLLSVEALEWLVTKRSAAAVAVLPRISADRIEPFPGIYEPVCRAALQALAGDRDGVRAGSLQRLAALAGVLTPEVPHSLASAFFGVNTLQDLQRLAAGTAGAQSPYPVQSKKSERSGE